MHTENNRGFQTERVVKMSNGDGIWYYYSGLAIVFFFDLDINEVAMRLHRVMKQLHEDRRYQMIVSSIEITHIEQVTKGREILEVPKHT